MFTTICQAIAAPTASSSPFVLEFTMKDVVYVGAVIIVALWELYRYLIARSDAKGEAHEKELMDRFTGYERDGKEFRKEILERLDTLNENINHLKIDQKDYVTHVQCQEKRDRCPCVTQLDKLARKMDERELHQHGQ